MWDMDTDLHHHGSVQELIHIMLSYGKYPSCPPKVAVWIKQGQVRQLSRRDPQELFPIPVVPRDEAPASCSASRQMKWPPPVLLSLLQHPHPGKGDKGVVSKQTGQCAPLGRHLGASQMEPLFLPSESMNGQARH